MPWDISIPIHSLDYLLMLNTLEYIENDQWSLSSANEKLKSDGKLILTVPNNKKIYSVNDKEIGILRRYEKNEIVEKLFIAGFKVDYFTYFESFTSFGKNLKIYKDKFFDEENFNFNQIPENNKQLIANSQIDIDTLQNKPLKYGNQMFIVCSKLTGEEIMIENEKKSKNVFSSLLNKITKKDDEE